MKPVVDRVTYFVYEFSCYCLSITARLMLCIHALSKARILNTLNAAISPKPNITLLLATARATVELGQLLIEFF